MKAAGGNKSKTDSVSKIERNREAPGLWETGESKEVKRLPRSWPCQNRARCGHIFPLCNQRLKSKFSSEMLVPASFKTLRRPNKTHLRATSGPPTASVPPPAELPSSPSVQFLWYLWGEGGQSRNGIKYPTPPAGTQTPFSTKSPPFWDVQPCELHPTG